MPPSYSLHRTASYEVTNPWATKIAKKEIKKELTDKDLSDFAEHLHKFDPFKLNNVKIVDYDKKGVTK